MSHEIEKCAFDDVTNRQLFMLELSAKEPLPGVDLGSGYFCCLLACDASNYTVEEVSELVDPLIDAGCVYFCCWGPDCERVHDIIDESDPYTDSVVMTTWHDKDTLEDALWFFLNVTWPDAKFENSFNASLAISIGSSEWASSTRSALEDPRAFSKMVLDKEERPNLLARVRKFFAKA